MTIRSKGGSFVFLRDRWLGYENRQLDSDAARLSSE